MSETLEILLTNDDGIDSDGFRVLYENLQKVGDVVAVAPADDRSAVGRAMSDQVTVHDHELGYAIDGTPADCAVAGLESLCPQADIVVAGCNRGANLGAYVLGRSGTVSAAVEAAFFDVPAIAVSLYVPVGKDEDFASKEVTRADYREAADATVYLTEHAPAAGVFERADYLNVNAPLPGDEPAPMRVTQPSMVYDMAAERHEEGLRLHDRTWERMAAGDVSDPAGTDRRAVVEGCVSVSPLTAPHTTSHHEALDGLAEAYSAG